MKNRLKEKKGITLAELIVTFGLTALFLVTAAAAMGMFLQYHLRMQNHAGAQSVATSVMNAISGRISCAKELSIEEDRVLFVDVEDRAADMTVSEEGYLQFTYYDTKAQETEVWAYGAEVYDGFRILELQVLPLENKEAVKIDLILKSERVNGYIFETSRSLLCYNLVSDIKIAR